MSFWSAILEQLMRIAVDAHAIGRRLTGNEVYIRSLLNALAGEGQDCEFVAYVSWMGPRLPFRAYHGAPRSRQSVTSGLAGNWLAGSAGSSRLTARSVHRTARLPEPVVVSVHDVSFLEHPEYFPRDRALQLRTTVGRTVQQRG